MIVKFNCPACDQSIETTEEAAQEGVRCPNCGTGFVPEKFKKVKPVPPPASPPPPATSPKLAPLSKPERKPRSTNLIALILIVSAILIYQQREEITATKMVADKLQTPATKWEYKVVEIENSKEKNLDDALTNNPPDIDKMMKSEEGAGFLMFYEAHDYSGLPVNLIELGHDGWELVSAVPQVETVVPYSSPNVRTKEVILLFRRPKE
jgi:hypothetical protein